MSALEQLSDQLKLQIAVSRMRELLEAPTKLSAKDLRACQSIARRLSDAVSFNSGWYMAAPDKHLPGTAATEKLFADLRTVVDYLQHNTAASKLSKVGRPKGSMKAIDDSYLHVISAHLSGSGKSLLQCVRAAAQKGLIDPKLDDTTHVRRVERYYKMLREKFAEPAQSAKVLQFPKRPRTKKPN